MAQQRPWWTNTVLIGAVIPVLAALYAVAALLGNGVAALGWGALVAVPVAAAVKRACRYGAVNAASPWERWLCRCGWIAAQTGKVGRHG